MMGENGKAQEINSSTSGQSQPSMDNQIETTQDNHLESSNQNTNQQVPRSFCDIL
uniref:Uncharacterized protein n=1 Tax=Meloidogyne enterolobii TaxID=390850 RepID=A0A6V7VAD1_MELEN|nr:unnamed protein product [Meloidogyne enterolobii]